jgi:hypothetical protein
MVYEAPKGGRILRMNASTSRRSYEKPMLGVSVRLAAYNVSKTLQFRPPSVCFPLLHYLRGELFYPLLGKREE